MHPLREAAAVGAIVALAAGVIAWAAYDLVRPAVPADARRVVGVATISIMLAAVVTAARVREPIDIVPQSPMVTPTASADTR